MRSVMAFALISVFGMYSRTIATVEFDAEPDIACAVERSYS